MKKLWLYIVLSTLVLFTLFAKQAPAQTTTLTTETTSNILSASPTFPGFADYRTVVSADTPNITPGFPIITQLFDPPPANISKLNVHSLLYPGFNGKILVETQTWFCPTVTQEFHRDYSQQNSHQFDQCNEHLVVGYDSDDVSHGNSAVDEMFSRGFDGFISDVSGGQNNCLTSFSPGPPASFTFTSPCQSKVIRVDNAVQAMMSRINSTYPNQMQFMLMEDQSAFDGSDNCLTADQNQALCIAQKIESDISYYNSTYFFANPNTYIKGAAGAPMVAFFIAEEHQGIDPTTNKPVNQIDLSQCDQSPCVFENGTTCTGTFVNTNQSTISNCWTAIWDSVRAHSPVPITMIFRNKPGFTHDQSDGSFQWVDPDPATSTAINESTQEDFTNGTEVDDFYTAAKTSGKIVFGLVKKGFDREDAPFSDNPLGAGKVTDQQCSQVWLNMFNKINSNFNTANQIPFVIVGTWDDYEEGTEIETGISDCHRVDVSGETGLVRWNLEPDGYPTSLGLPYPPGTTVNHYALYSSTDGQNLSLLKDNISCQSGVNCSLDVLPLATNLPNGTYTFFVKAVGQPSITNHMGQMTQTLKDFAVHFTDSGNSPFDVFVSSRPGNTDTFNLTGSSNVPGFTINTPTVTVGVVASVTVNIPPGEGEWKVSITATDTRTGGTDTISFDLIVAGDPSFSVPFAPSSATVTAGGAASFTANESSTSGFSAPVNLSAGGLPSGATASFSPATISGGSGSSQLTISTSRSTPPGTYTITISASDGGFTQNQSVSLTVNAPPPPPPPPPPPCGRFCLNQ